MLAQDAPEFVRRIIGQRNRPTVVGFCCCLLSVAQCFFFLSFLSFYLFSSIVKVRGVSWRLVAPVFFFFAELLLFCYIFRRLPLSLRRHLLLGGVVVVAAAVVLWARARARGGCWLNRPEGGSKLEKCSGCLKLKQSGFWVKKMLPKTHIIVEANPTLDRAEQQRVRELAARLERERRECSELEQLLERARRRERKKAALRGKLFGSAGSGFVEDSDDVPASRELRSNGRGNYRHAKSKGDKHKVPSTASSNNNNKRGAIRPNTQAPGHSRSTRHTVARVEGEIRRRGPGPQSSKANKPPGDSRRNRKHRPNVARESGDRTHHVTVGNRKAKSKRRKDSRNSQHASAPFTSGPPRTSVNSAAVSSAAQPAAVDPIDSQKDGAVSKRRARDVHTKPLTFEGEPLDRQFWQMVFSQIDSNSDGVICARDLAFFLDSATSTDAGGVSSRHEILQREVKKPARRAAILRTILAKTLRSQLRQRGRSNSFVGSLFPSLDSFGRGTISKDDFLDVLYRGEDLVLQHRQKAALMPQRVVDTIMVDDDIPPAQPGTPSANRTPTTSHSSKISGAAPPNTTTAVCTTPESVSKKHSVLELEEPNYRGVLLRGSDDEPKSIQRRARLGDQLAFRRSVLAAVFLAIVGAQASDTASVSNALITGRDLQDFLASSDSDHKCVQHAYYRPCTL